MARITRRFFLALSAAAAAPFKWLADLAGPPEEGEYAAEVEAAMDIVASDIEHGTAAVWDEDEVEVVEAETTYTTRFQDGSSRTEKARWEFRVNLETMEVEPVRVPVPELVGEDGPMPKRSPEDFINGVRAMAARYDDPEERERMDEDERRYAADCSKTVKLWDRGEAEPPTEWELKNFIEPSLDLSRELERLVKEGRDKGPDGQA